MYVRIRRPASLFLLLVCLSGGNLAHAAGQSKKTPRAQTRALPSAPPYIMTPGFFVKPSDITVPSDVPIGQYQRVIRPFPNWTLICDENRAKKQKVCNISQTIVGSHGATVFSWSLAAAQNGQPFFILRLPPSVGEGQAIQLDLSDGGPVVPVPIRGCTEQTCIGYQQVGARLRAAVAKGLAPKISYSQGTPPEAISFTAPFDGLAAALGAI